MDKHQCVKVNGTLSSWEWVSSGVPQGSVLGPLLFALYVNELLSLVSSELLMFADDIKLYRTIRSPEDCLILQRDIKLMYYLNGQNIGSCHLMLQNVKLYTLVVLCMCMLVTTF